MKHHVLFSAALVAALSACDGQTPIAPSTTAPWCQTDVSILVGRWQTEHIRGGHSYKEELDIAQQDACLLTYSYRAHRLADEHHTEEVLVYRSEGDIVVLEAEQAGPVVYLTIESRRWLAEAFDQQGEVVTRDSSLMVIRDDTRTLVWADNLVLWGNQYQRE